MLRYLAEVECRLFLVVCGKLRKIILSLVVSHVYVSSVVKQSD